MGGGGDCSRACGGRRPARCGARATRCRRCSLRATRRLHACAGGSGVRAVADEPTAGEDAARAADAAQADPGLGPAHATAARAARNAGLRAAAEITGKLASLVLVFALA